MSPTGPNVPHEAPAGDRDTEYAARRARLSDDKRKLLARLRAARGPQPPRAPRRLDRREGRLETSVAQEQLWFLDRLAPGEPTYHVAQAHRLVGGGLDPEALRQALCDVAARHEALHTVIGEHEGMPYQLLRPGLEPGWATDDLTGLAGEDRPAPLAELLHSAVHDPLDLTTGPLLRARLIRTGEDEHVLVVTGHHAVLDGWSLGIVHRDLSAAYTARRTGSAPDRNPPHLQYTDFAAWQRQRLRSGDFDTALERWAEHLAGVAPLDLPTDRPRGAVADNRGAYARHRTADGLRDALHASAARLRVTPLALVSAAFATVLGRYTRSSDIPFGTIASGRTRPEAEDVVGCFANSVVLRADLSGEPSFAGLARRLHEECLAAWDRQDVPFERVVERVRPTRAQGRNPLFQVSLQLLDDTTGGGRPLLPGIAAEPVDLELDRARFDLTLSVVDQDDGLTFVTEYAVALFDADRIGRLHRHLEHVLRAGLDAPDRPVAGLPLMTGAEERRTLTLGTGPALPAPVPGVLHGGLAEWADRCPGTAAVVDGATTLTYRELADRSTEVARRLCALGVRPGDVVAVAADRGHDQITTLLGVLRAGAVHVPVDPGSPAGRLRHILHGTGARLLLTARPGLADSPESLPDGCVRHTLPLAGGPPAPSAELPAARPHTLAYVLHTSGSTGVPKGVALEHGGLTSYCAWMADEWGLRPGDRVLHTNAPVFDMAVGEVFAALTSGATVVCASREAVLTPGALTALIAGAGVTHVFTTPTVLGLVDPRACPDVRGVMVAGEPCPAHLVERWLTPGRRFHNAYGPTEASVAATAAEFHEVPERPAVGRPLPGRRAWVVDHALAPQPVGVPGEILLGGIGLARGYFGRPDLTAERFVTVPFADGPVYRTGDLGHFDAHGVLHYDGRLDDQIKVRGLRIEPGEVEAALRRRPEVADAVVVAREDRLAGYVVPAPGAVCDPAALRAHAAVELPAAMVPETLTVLERLPLGPTGKVDRAALPAPVAGGARGPLGSAPATPVEKAVATAFAEVCGTAEARMDDDFFALGGNSLRAAGLLARIASATGVTVPMSDFYAQPTVAAVARLVTAAGPSPAPVGRSPLVPVKPHGDLPPLVCPHAISGSPYWYLGLSRHIDPRRPLLGFEAPGIEGGTPPLTDLTALAGRYREALLAHRPEGPYLLAGWSMGGVVAFEIARQLRERGAGPVALAIIDSSLPGPYPHPDEQRIIELFTTDLAGLAGRPVPDLDPALAGLPEAERVERLAKTLAATGLVPADVNPRFIADRYRVFAANVRALYGYRPGRYDGPALLVRGSESDDTADGWRRLVGGELHDVVLPGDHYTLWAEERLSELARALEAGLGACR
ncbi:non-ribosomal peptide synthetase [Streptomyces griseoincarnatus]